MIVNKSKQKRNYNNLNVKISNELITLILNSRSWNQSELAKKVNVVPSTINKILFQKRTLSFELFSRLLSLLTDKETLDFADRLKKYRKQGEEEQNA